MRWGAVGYIMGVLVAGLGAFMMLPAATAFVWHEPAAMVFALCGVLVLTLGGVLMVMNHGRDVELGHREGFLITFLAWFGLSLLAAWPFYALGDAPTLVDAWFEAVSGLTTTGATVMTGLDDKSHAVMLWRALLQWLGGMGIVVLAVAVLPFLGVGGLQLYRSELPGVTKDRLQPRLRQTARALWIVYGLLTVACAALYWVGGMGRFEALCHALTTVSSGGFSTHDASFGAFAGNPFLEAVCMVFMLAAGVNFALHFRAISGWGLRAYRDIELRVMLGLIGFGALGVGGMLVLYGTLPWLEAFWYGLFNVMTLLTGTGYTNHDYDQWPVAVKVFLLALMFIGGCSGSTSGGMKVLRIWVIVQAGRREFFKLIHPHGVRPVKLGMVSVHPDVLQAVGAFAGLFVVSFMAITMLVAATGVDLVTAFATSVATLSNVGPAMGAAGPATTYADLPLAAKFVLTWSMLLGRLELYTVILVFLPRFWRG